MIEIVIANIVNLLAGSCSILSTQGKNKRQIIFIEFIGSIFRIIMNFLVKSWSDMIAKIIKALAQIFYLKNKLNKKLFYLISLLYIIICLVITYLSNDFRCLVAIIPSVLEFYALLDSSTKKYRWYVIITKIFWTINNIIFKLYAGIIFDAIIVIAHFIKIKNKSDSESITYKNN